MSLFDSSSVSYCKGFFCSSPFTATSYPQMCYFQSGELSSLPLTYVKCISTSVPLHSLSPRLALSSTIFMAWTHSPLRSLLQCHLDKRTFPGHSVALCLTSKPTFFCTNPLHSHTPFKFSSLIEIRVSVYLVFPPLVPWEEGLCFAPAASRTQDGTRHKEVRNKNVLAEWDTRDCETFSKIRVNINGNWRSLPEAMVINEGQALHYLFQLARGLGK